MHPQRRARGLPQIDEERIEDFIVEEVRAVPGIVRVGARRPAQPCSSYEDSASVGAYGGLRAGWRGNENDDLIVGQMP